MEEFDDDEVLRLDDDEVVRLKEALERARKFAAEVEEARAEAERSPPEGLSDEQLAQGREALENAAAAARRMLDALEGAYQIAVEERQDDAHERDDDPDAGQSVH